MVVPLITLRTACGCVRYKRMSLPLPDTILVPLVDHHRNYRINSKITEEDYPTENKVRAFKRTELYEYTEEL